MTIREHAEAAKRAWVNDPAPEMLPLVDYIERACLAVEQETAARVTAEMTVLICKAEQDERARIAKLWRAVLAEEVDGNIEASLIELPDIGLSIVALPSDVLALSKALAPDPVQVRAEVGAPDVVTCGACGQTPCSCAPDCKCGRPSCGGQCEPE